MLTERVERWRAAGELVEFRGRRLYTQVRAGERPMLLLLHGYPSSSYDWRGLLAAHPRNAALMFDCLGFGLSDKPTDHLYTLAWQADAAEELVRRAGSPPVFLVAHDMGTSVATELLARAVRGELSIELEGALLFNGNILIELASLTIAQKILRSPAGRVFSLLSNERAFRAQFARLFSSAHPLSPEEGRDQWSLIAYNGGRTIMHRTIYYLHERARLRERWHGAFRDFTGSLSLAWGLRDPVATTAVLDGLRELRPGVPVHELPDLGHYPQIEDADALAGALAGALADALAEARVRPERAAPHD
jgi:pimeloyl-ACP methyl ester carboxylesterase